MTQRKEKVIIVGAGMAGLTAAAYLSKHNYEVLLLEKNHRTGGLVSTFKRDGFSFDTGPRAFVNSGMVKPILRDLGLDYDFVDNKISIGIENELFQVNSLESIDEYKKILFKLYPNHKQDIEKIMPIIKKLSEYTAVLYEFDNPYFVDYISNKKVLFKEFLPWTLRLVNVLRKFNKYNTPMEDFLGKITENQSLMDILTQYFFRKTPTYFALGYFHVYLDYFYPKKGTGTLPNLLENMMLEQGVTLQLDKEIVEVIPYEKKVRDSEGKIYSYDHLIWSADLKSLYHQLNTKDLNKKTMKKLEIQRDKVLTSKAAESSLNVFVGVDRAPSYFKNISGEHMFYTPSKNGLGEINRREKQDLLENFDQKSKQDIIEWLHRFCDYNTYEVSIPVLRDSSLAPKNQTGIMISCLFDYHLIKKIDEKGWIKEFKEIVEKRIIKIFSETIFPKLEEDVIFRLSSNPLTIQSLTGNSEGGIVGWSFDSKPPVYNKLKDIGKAVFTPLPDIYKASQWAYAPAGVPIAMLTGWHATQKILKKSKSKKK